MAKPTKSKGSSQTRSKSQTGTDAADKIEDAVVVDEDPGAPALAEATAEAKNISDKDVTPEDAAPKPVEDTPPDSPGKDAPATGTDAPEGDPSPAETGAASPTGPQADDGDDPKDMTSEMSEISDTSDSLDPGSEAADSVAAASSDDTLTASDALSDTQSANDTATGAPPVAPVVQEKVIVKKGGFVPALLGGVVAAGLGFGGAQVLGPDYWLFGSQDAGPDPFQTEVTQSLSTQADQLAALSGRIDGAESALAQIETAPLASAIESQSTVLSGLQQGVSGLETALAGLNDRLTTLEKRPVTEAVSPEAIAAYERELEALRSDITAQRAEIETLAAEAVAAEQSANQQAALAQGRAALAEVMSAVDNGAPMAGALATLTTATGLDAPPELAEVATEGVPPLGTLIEEFPQAARAALAASRRSDQAAEDAEEGGLAGFLSRQLGARSLTPREGSSPDAVLSRAEAAVRNGDLKTALAEIQALPEAGQAALSEWVTRASARVSALDAAAALSQQLNSSE